MVTIHIIFKIKLQFKKFFSGFSSTPKTPSASILIFLRLKLTFLKNSNKTLHFHKKIIAKALKLMILSKFMKNCRKNEFFAAKIIVFLLFNAL